jgi:hypothetical protein
MTEVQPVTDLRSTRPQFTLASLLWTMFLIAMALVYLRQFHSQKLLVTGCVMVCVAAVFGAIVGSVRQRAADASYWAVVATAAAYLSVAGERSHEPLFQVAWASVGMVAASFGGAVAAQRVFRRMLLAGFTGGLTMLFFSTDMQAGPEMLFDLICAPIVGALIGLLIECILWIERRARIARYVTATWLLLAVVAGNWLVPLVRG